MLSGNTIDVVVAKQGGQKSKHRELSMKTNGHGNRQWKEQMNYSGSGEGKNEGLEDLGRNSPFVAPILGKWESDDRHVGPRIKVWAWLLWVRVRGERPTAGVGICAGGKAGCGDEHSSVPVPMKGSCTMQPAVSFGPSRY